MSTGEIVVKSSIMTIETLPDGSILPESFTHRRISTEKNSLFWGGVCGNEYHIYLLNPEDQKTVEGPYICSLEYWQIIGHDVHLEKGTLELEILAKQWDGTTGGIVFKMTNIATNKEY